MTLTIASADTTPLPCDTDHAPMPAAELARRIAAIIATVDDGDACIGCDSYDDDGATFAPCPDCGGTYCGREQCRLQHLGQCKAEMALAFAGGWDE